MTTLEFIKAEAIKSYETYAAKYDTTVEVYFGDEVSITFNAPYLEVSFENGYRIFADSENNEKEEGAGHIFTCAYKTPKGYISSKKIPVNIADKNNVTIEEAEELLKFNTDAKKNTFDPFYAENEARRRNNAAWNFIGFNYLQDDCR